MFLVRTATVHGLNIELQFVSQRIKDIEDLLGQFTGWCENERGRTAWFSFLSHSQERQSESESFAGARRCSTANISTQHCIRNRFPLNFKRFNDSLLLEGIDQKWFNSKIFKRYHRLTPTDGRHPALFDTTSRKSRCFVDSSAVGSAPNKHGYGVAAAQTQRHNTRF